MNFDNFNRNLILHMSSPATRSATVTSSTCDLAGYEAASFYVAYGTISSTDGSNYWSAKLQESDDDSSYTDVSADDINGSTANLFGVCNSAADDDATYGIGYKGKKRYIQVVVTKTGSPGNALMFIFAVKDDARYAPTGQTVQGS